MQLRNVTSDSVGRYETPLVYSLKTDDDGRFRFD